MPRSWGSAASSNPRKRKVNLFMPTSAKFGFPDTKPDFGLPRGARHPGRGDRHTRFRCSVRGSGYSIAENHEAVGSAPSRSPRSPKVQRQKRQTATPGREWPFDLGCRCVVNLACLLRDACHRNAVTFDRARHRDALPTHSLELVLGVKLVDFSLRNQNVRGPAGNAILDASAAASPAVACFAPQCESLTVSGNGFASRKG